MHEEQKLGARRLEKIIEFKCLKQVSHNRTHNVLLKNRLVKGEITFGYMDMNMCIKAHVFRKWMQKTMATANNRQFIYFYEIVSLMASIAASIKTL